MIKIYISQDINYRYYFRLRQDLSDVKFLAILNFQQILAGNVILQTQNIDVKTLLVMNVETREHTCKKWENKTNVLVRNGIVFHGAVKNCIALRSSTVNCFIH